MLNRYAFGITALALFGGSSCFSTLPMSDSYARQGESRIFEWLSREPLLEAFPVNYDKSVRAAGPAFQANSDISRSYSLTMVRNAANIEGAIGKPLREKFRNDKLLTISGLSYSEKGTGSMISDVAETKMQMDYSGNLSFLEAEKAQQNHNLFSGYLQEKIKLNGSVSLISISSKVDAVTDGDYIAVRNLESGELIGLNIPGLPVMPARPIHVGAQWEITGYTEQKTQYRYPAGTPPANLAAATLMLITYQFNGYTTYGHRVCAYIEFFGETYEMRDFGGKSSLPALKAVAKTLSRSPISEVRAYLSRREYGSGPGLKGSFQASAKIAGYSLIDTTSRKLVIAKMGKEGLTGGGSSIGIVEGNGKGVFREQWVLEEKTK